MRKPFLYLAIVILILVSFPNTAMANEKPPIHKTEHVDEIPEEIKIMIDRIYEIREMDKSNLSREERKELRKELKTIKKAVKASGNGIYISSGAIIIILLLIIIL